MWDVDAWECSLLSCLCCSVRIWSLRRFKSAHVSADAQRRAGSAASWGRGRGFVKIHLTHYLTGRCALPGSFFFLENLRFTEVDGSSSQCTFCCINYLDEQQWWNVTDLYWLNKLNNTLLFVFTTEQTGWTNWLKGLEGDTDSDCFTLFMCGGPCHLFLASNSILGILFSPENFLFIQLWKRYNCDAEFQSPFKYNLKEMTSCWKSQIECMQISRRGTNCY